MRAIDDLVAEIECLKARCDRFEKEMTLVSHWHNTLCTPWYKSLWFFIQGYRIRCLGTWYTAPWNKAMGDKYNGKLG